MGAWVTHTLNWFMPNSSTSERGTSAARSSAAGRVVEQPTTGQFALVPTLPRTSAVTWQTRQLHSFGGNGTRMGQQNPDGKSHLGNLMARSEFRPLAADLLQQEFLCMS